MSREPALHSGGRRGITSAIARGPVPLVAVSILAAVSLLQEQPNPTEADVREGLEGNLCRCTGYHNIVKAVLAASGSAGVSA